MNTEATGRHEHAFVFACDQAELHILVVNPISIRRYAQGKLPKATIIACMRKFIVVLHTMFKNEELWRHKTA